MKQDDIFTILCQHLSEVIPELNQRPITPSDSLKALGANSLDRAEIIMLTMAQLKVKIPLVDFARAENIQGIVEVFQRSVAQQAQAEQCIG